MKQQHWTLGLASLGVISLGSMAYAEEVAMSQVLTAVSSTTLSGYIDTSVVWKPGTGNGGAVGSGFNDAGELVPGTMPGRFNDGSSKMDGFNMNVVGLTIERPLNEDLWAAGFRADLLFGPDAVGYNPVGDSSAELAIKQAYANLMVPIGNGLELKMGVFNTIIGYESFESYLNPNYGRSYGWQIEPTQHTGLLGSYQLSEAVAVNAGIANTWVWGVDTRSPRAESFKSYLASVAVTAPDSWGALSGSTWSGGVVTGDDLGLSKNTVSLYTGLNFLTGLEGFSVGLAFDYRMNGPNVFSESKSPDRSENWAYALGGYLSFAATEKLTLNARIDYLNGSDGTFYDAGGSWLSGVYVGDGVADTRNELFALTGTADYALWANVLSRLEIRWDTALNGDAPFGTDDKNAVTVTGNVVFVF
jgi:hypothetical protein